MHKAMRDREVVIDGLPPPEADTPRERPWSFRWIESPAWSGDPTVVAFRLRFLLEDDAELLLRLTGDQRYALHLDGRRIGFGPERGSHKTWFLQTHALKLVRGSHVLVALVSWMPMRDDLSHHGHIGLSPGFALYAEGCPRERFNTGFAPWECLVAKGYGFRPASAFEGFVCFIGARTDFDMREQPEGLAEGADGAGAWRPATVGAWARTLAFGPVNAATQRMLHAGLLPAMHEGVCRLGTVRHAVSGSGPVRTLRDLPFLEATNDSGLAASFQKTLDGGGVLTLPSYRAFRFLVDAEDYVCVWPVATVSGGHGAHVSIEWAESLFRGLIPGTRKKDNRDQMEGKFFIGFGDSFIADGSELPRTFEPLWWEAGRYVLVTVKTSGASLCLHTLRLRETHYPYAFASSFVCDDPRWDGVLRISRRTLEMCSHETYFDCPYYEQLMYGGDTRVEILCSYANSLDDRLARKAIYLFDRSRDDRGLTRVVVPCVTDDCIPPFSLWWVMMVHDQAWWRNDPDFVKARMPGVRAVLEAYRAHIDGRGLLRLPPGWNFTDWAEGGGWDHGVPPIGPDGVNATLAFHLALVLKAAAELEELFGETALAARNRATAETLVRAAVSAFWMPEHSLFAETSHKDGFSEHAQCLAVLCGGLPEGVVPDLLLRAAGGEAVRTTCYFAHYLFEAFRARGMVDALFDRMGIWFAMVDNGLRTTVESHEPTRSDCHAWSAHPMFHAYATVAGIRPASPGFRAVRLAPQFGSLKRIAARLVHPDGFVSVELERMEGGGCFGRLAVPAGIPATAELPDGRRFSWEGGELAVEKK